MRLLISSLALLASSAATAPAEVTVVTSVEWLTAHSDLVAIGRAVDSHREAKGTFVRFELSEVIKGPASAGDRVSIWRRGGEWGGTGESPSADRLFFSRVAKSSDESARDEPTGKYTLTESRATRSVYSAASSAKPFYTPSFAPVKTLDGIAARARMFATRERRLAKIEPFGKWRTEWLKIPETAQVHAAHSGGSGVYLLVPVLRGKLTHGPEENRLLEAYPAAKVSQPVEQRAAGSLLDAGQRAFSNRGYTWRNVPGVLSGWGYRMTRGGEPEELTVVAQSDGHVFAAVESKSAGQLEAQGWTRWPGISRDGFTYSDRGRTPMAVLVRKVSSGDVVYVPKVGWTGTLLLSPPRYQGSLIKRR